jgi:hypothetical protein
MMRLAPPNSTIESITSDLGSFGLDEADGRYISNAKSAFDDLRQIVSQLAGLLLLSKTIGRSGFADLSLLARAKELFAEAGERIETLRPGARSRHHDRHLRNAVELVGSLLMAIDRARLKTAAPDHALSILKAAWQELVHASNALPGFETVDLSQSCCASHMKLRNTSIIACDGVPE